MIAKCKMCGVDHTGKLANHSVARGMHFDIINDTYSFWCPEYEDWFTHTVSWRDYLGEAESGPDGRQGRRIGP